MSTNSLTAEREHLANLLEAVQRCAQEWPLDGHRLKQWQMDEALFEALAAFHKRFAKLQDTLGAAMRHSALLENIPSPCRRPALAKKRRCPLPRWGRAGVGASMRRSVSAGSPHPRLPPEGEGADHDGTTGVLFLLSEANAPFLKVLALFEKLAVIESIDAWQMCRTARNLAAHDYETDCALIAEHFNELHTLQPVLAQPKVALISGVTGENTDCVKMHPRTPLTSGVRLAYEQLPYPWVSTYGDHKPISAWAFASRHRPGGTRMALRLTRAVFTWRAID